jgi:hypothetical protein
MARADLKQFVEQTVSEVLEQHVAQAREELVKRVMAEIELTQPEATATGSETADLLQDLAAIHLGRTQKEVLGALLNATVRYSGRSALFVVKSGSATGWQSRGFEGGDGIKDFALDGSAAAPANVMASRCALRGKVADMDAQFVARFGAPAADQILLAPLHLKDKVAALVYADRGMDSGKNFNCDAVELLVAATSAWLEVAALRKHAAKEEAEGTATEHADAPHHAPPTPAAPAYSDPFAAHVPQHAAAPVEIPVAMASSAQAAGTAGTAGTAGSAAATAPAADPFADLSVEDAETHRKAQRFARLLINEIKLYNQAKLVEGRNHKDLYDRLKDDIDKSQAAYVQRYGQSVAAGADYFNQQLIATLAENDVTLLGPNYHP